LELVADLKAVGRVGLLIGGLALVLLGTLLIFGLPVVPSLQYLAQGAFGDKFGWSRTGVKTVPLLLTGLGMVVAWRGGMYNIGGEGQFVLGGLAGGWLAKFAVAWLAVPAPLITGCILVAAAIGGALWSLLAGWLYVRRGVAVVISTILLNFVALQILGWAVSGPLQETKHELPLSELLPDRLMLWRFDRQTDLNAGLFFAILVAVGIWFFLYRTRAGFRIRVVGDNPRVARANRIDSARTQLLAMAISGALCGLAGGIEYSGVARQLGTGFSQQWGFLGIPVALLGGLHPLLVILSAAFFGALFAGSENLARFTPAGTTLIYIIQSTAVLGFVGFKAWNDRTVTREGD
jgi:ABC-type uncharacterized transport system permease subunit